MNQVFVDSGRLPALEACGRASEALQSRPGKSIDRKGKLHSQIRRIKRLYLARFLIIYFFPIFWLGPINGGSYSSARKFTLPQRSLGLACVDEMIVLAVISALMRATSGRFLEFYDIQPEKVLAARHRAKIRRTSSRVLGVSTVQRSEP